MKAVIIEDEERCRMVLKNLLESYCPEVEIVAMADSVTGGIQEWRSCQPDVVFLDVEITGGTGFDVLEAMHEESTAVVFTTAYDQFALKALKLSAMDYLLKPIDIDELKSAVQKVQSFHRAKPEQRIQNLLNNIRNPQEPPVLLVSTQDTVEFVPVDEIIRCEAHGAYTKLILRAGKPVMVSKVIKEYDYLLRDYSFCRVHQSHVVNLKDVRKYVKSENYLLMSDGAQIQLARSRKEEFFGMLNAVRGVKMSG